MSCGCCLSFAGNIARTIAGSVFQNSWDASNRTRSPGLMSGFMVDNHMDLWDKNTYFRVKTCDVLLYWGEMMKKIQAKSLVPGDLWQHGQDQHPWIFIEGKEFICPISEIVLWELTWFGRKNSERHELIKDNWTSDSRFFIISREEG